MRSERFMFVFIHSAKRACIIYEVKLSSLFLFSFFLSLSLKMHFNDFIIIPLLKNEVFGVVVERLFIYFYISWQFYFVVLSAIYLCTHELLLGHHRLKLRILSERFLPLYTIYCFLVTTVSKWWEKLWCFTVL